jgi:glucokinase
VGNRAIVANAVTRLKKNSKGARGNMLLNRAGGDPGKITPRMLTEAANEGDEIALEVWRHTGHCLGAALAVLVNLLNPECFIIGGGVAKAGAILFDGMRNTMVSLAMNQLGRETPILEAQLSEDAGVIGAATVAMGCVEKGYLRT